MDEKVKKYLQENLVRPSDIADRVFVGRPAVSQWIQRYPDFPEPLIAVEGRTFGIYWWPDVQAWLKENDMPRMNKPSARKAREGRMIRALGWPGFDLD